MALSDLSVSLTAKTDGFESALQRAAKATEQTAASVKASTDRISSSFELLKGAAAGAAGALSISAFTNLVKGSIDAADHLNDLSQKTGIAVVTLGGMGFAAEQAGGDLDSMAKGLGKLNLSIASAAAGNAQAKEAFDAIGVSIKDAAGNTRTADQVFAAIADKFAGFEDGPNKAALAVRLFGKAGADLIPVLNEGGAKLKENAAYYERYSGVTADLAAKSDAFNDSLTKLHLLQGAFGKQLAAELLPTLQALANSFLDSKEKGTGFKTVAEGIGETFKYLVVAGGGVALIFEEIGKTIGGTAAQIAALAHLDFKGFAAIGDAMRADTAEASKTFEAFRQRILSATPQVRQASKFEGDPYYQSKKVEAPGLPKTGGSSSAKVDDPSKKLLEQELKQLDIFIAREKELYGDRNQALQLAYQADEVSLDSYFDGRKAAREAELGNVIAFYDKEIAAEQAYIANISKSDPRAESKRVEAQTKIIEITEKRRKAEHDGAQEALRDDAARKKSIEQYSDQLSGLAAQVASLRGDTAAAFKINFDIQTRSLTDKVNLNLKSDDPATRQAAEAAKQNLDALRQQGLVTSSINDLETQRSKTMLELQNATERVNIAVSSGQATELEGLARLSAANAARVASLQQVIDAEQKLAETSQDPLALARVDALRVEMEKLASQTDLVGDKFRALGESATENFINKLADGTGKLTDRLKDAFKGLVTDINKELLKIESKEISQSLFKKDGTIGSLFSQGTSAAGDAGKTTDGSSSSASGTSSAKGLSGFLQSLFGGGKSSAGAGQSKSASTAPTAAGSGIDAALSSLNASSAAVEAAFTALATSSGTLDASFVALGATLPTVDSSLLQLTVTAPILDSALSSLASSAASASVALQSVKASGGGGGGGNYSELLGDTGSDYWDEFLALFGSAKGNIFNGGNVVPFATGTIVHRPTYFPMRDGRTGLMGEAGPEAIMPTTKTASGGFAVHLVSKDGQPRSLPLVRDFAGRLAVASDDLDRIDRKLSAAAPANDVVMGPVTAFARGGLVDRPTMFPMRAGAQAEGIAPLRRTQRSAMQDGGGDTFHNTSNFTFEAPASRQTQSQIANAVRRQMDSVRRKRSA